MAIEDGIQKVAKTAHRAGWSGGVRWMLDVIKLSEGDFKKMSGQEFVKQMQDAADMAFEKEHEEGRLK